MGWKETDVGRRKREPEAEVERGGSKAAWF
jgi:hypothetical protein